MTTLRFEVKTYEVLLGKTIGVGFKNLNYASGVIRCWGAGGEELMVVFASSPALADAGSNFANVGQKRGGIVAPMSSFGFYLDLLREEGPVYAQIDSTSPDSLNLLETGLEPVADPGR
jgi:hypothetical protein